MKLSECKNAEDLLRWHLLHDCICGVPNEYYNVPSEHQSSCPMYNPDDEAWDYID